MTKICTHCKIDKPTEQFYVNRKRKSGLQSWCKVCVNDGNRRFRDTHKEHIKAQVLARRAKDPKAYLAYYRNYRKQNKDRINTNNKRGKLNRDLWFQYLIREPEYWDLVKQQGGVCAVCHKAEVTIRHGKQQRLSVDHDHETGFIRGLLCAACNGAIGLFRENPHTMRRAADYIEGFVAKRLVS